MNIKKNLCLLGLMTIIINPIINHLESAYANQINLQASNNSIPEAIIKKAYSKVHKLPIPITKAYEKNADNEWVRVPVVRKNNMQLMSLPNDGIHTYTLGKKKLAL